MPYVNKRRKKRTIKWKNVFILVAVLSFLFLYVAPRAYYISKGFSIISSNRIGFSTLRYNIKYSDSLDEILKSKGYSRKYFDDYTYIATVMREKGLENQLEDPAIAINNIKETFDYGNNDIASIIGNLNNEEVDKLLASTYIEYIGEFVSLSYFDIDRLMEYDEYAKQESDKFISEIVLDVNLFLNYEPYTKIIDVEDPTAVDILVNKYYRLPKDYEPEGLRLPNVLVADFTRLLTDEAATAWENLIEDSKKQNFKIGLLSAYRSYDLQEVVYNDFLNRNGLEYADAYAARPGHSEHQTGLSLDFYLPYSNVCIYGECLVNTPEYKWIKDNSQEYGFIISYAEGKEHITGYNFEPWHLRYVGIELATYLNENNLTINEYYGFGKEMK